MGFSTGGLVLAFAIGIAAPAALSPTCIESALVCDVDGDRIVDVVEEAVCGSATCATGSEDLDADGVADVDELAASLRTGGPNGPVQRQSPDTLLVVASDGSITEVSLWLLAGGASLFLATIAAAAVARRIHTSREVAS